MYLYLDIETLPPSGGGHFERIKAGIKPPAQYKKPESIAQWLAENADAEAQAQVDRLGLNGLYGEVACVCFAIDDGDVMTFASRDDEPAVLAEVFEAIDLHATDGTSSYPRQLTPVGHNIEFDIRFLFHRAVRHGLPVPRAIRKAFDPDRGRYATFDTMKVWSGWKDYVKLTELTRELCGDQVDDIAGNEVALYWRNGQREKVIEHCVADVRRVRDLHRMMRVALD